MKSDRTAEQESLDNEPGHHRDRGSVLSVIQGVLAAALGIQSSENRERDFSEGGPRRFIIAGLLFCLLFVTTLVALVRWITTS